MSFYCSRVGPYKGDLFSTRERERERERERDRLLHVVVWVFRMVVHSHTPGMSYRLARSSYESL
jgi:hypothetical protein